MQLLNNTTPLSTHTHGYDAMSRLATVSDGANTAAYARIAGASLLSTTTVSRGGSTALTTTRAYDNLNRLTSISSTPTLQPSNLRTFNYTYNTLDKRTKTTLADGSYWLYEYDDLGQVTSGKKFNANSTPVAGSDFGYEFDTIGNRTQCSTGFQPVISSYTSNNLNQYTARTVPGVINILGTASTDATVKIHYGLQGLAP